MTRPKVILPGRTFGILGGGQLGRMFAMAAQHMGYKVIAYCPEADCPVSQVCMKTICAPFEDTDSLVTFARQVDVVTLEFENIPAQALEKIQSQVDVRPGASVLHICQNRLREKSYLADHKFPVVPFEKVTGADELKSALKRLGLPAVLKTAGFGYDGKGQKVLDSELEAESAWQTFGGQTAIVEQFVRFNQEISVIGARNASGDFVVYGPIQNEHRHHILDLSFAPASVTWTLAEEAIDITRSLMESLDVVGLLCVEFFVTPQETLLINELAPRPHNSGHLSIEACPVSQFEQQVRAIAGLPLGKTEPECGAAMANLLGDLFQAGEPDWVSAVSIPNVHLHLYGKRQSRPGRKMGHLTALARWADEALATVKSARELLVPSRK